MKQLDSFNSMNKLQMIAKGVAPVLAALLMTACGSAPEFKAAGDGRAGRRSRNRSCRRPVQGRRRRQHLETGASRPKRSRAASGGWRFNDTAEQ